MQHGCYDMDVFCHSMLSFSSAKLRNELPPPMTEWLAGMKFFPAHGCLILYVSSYQVVQVNHRFGMSVVWDVVAIEAVWHAHDSHYKLWSIWRPGCTIVLTCQHLLQPCIPCKHFFLGCLAWFHNVFTMFHTYVTCVPNLGAFCRTTWLAILGQDRFTKGLTMEIARMHDGPRFSWRENTLLHRKQQNPSKQPKLSTVPQMQGMLNARYVISHCIILASLGQHHSLTYVPYLRPNNHTYLPCLVLCLPQLEMLTYIEWYIACPTMSAC